MSSTKNLILRAAQFAREAHDGQTRKHGHADRPYFTHVVRVGGRAAALGLSEDAVAAGYLHDVVEDCDQVSIEVVEAEFGNGVATLVLEMTNPSKGAGNELDRSSKKEMDRRHLATVSHEAKVLKLLDRIDNLQECLDDDESPSSFLGLYVRESRLLLDEALKGAHPDLEAELEALIRKGEEKATVPRSKVNFPDYTEHVIRFHGLGPLNVRLVWTTDVGAFIEALNESEHGFEPGVVAYERAAYCLWTFSRSRVYCVFHSDERDWGVYFHEFEHAVLRGLQVVGVPLGDDTHEVYAMAMGHLASKACPLILERLERA